MTTTRRSNFVAGLRTTALMAALGGLLVVIGYVTSGITQLLSEDELRGVISHELSHIRNRDILTQSVASAIGAMITWIAYMMLWFGGEDNSPLGLFANLALFLLAPISATLIQLAISRQREYSADATGAEICGNPESLASAL